MEHRNHRQVSEACCSHEAIPRDGESFFSCYTHEPILLILNVNCRKLVSLEERKTVSTTSL